MKAPTKITKAAPIHIPSNKDIPRPVRPTEPEYEVFDMRVDNTPEYRMTTTDAEKALKDLMTDVKDGGDIEINMEDAIVAGFKDNVRLLPHQVIGRTWMKERETGKRTGGILADDMGLGKTVQTLVRIVDGRPTKSAKAEGYAAATLVVCPVAVVGQWASEIRKYAEGLTVIEHHGPNRATDPEKLKKAHVVITSYSIVANEHATYAFDATDESKPKKSKKSAAAASDDNSDDSESNFARALKKKSPVKQKDALFKVKWWRIVLDEAHNIKNKTTKSAIGCYALDGKYRWCLTGTPMQNSVDELYSLIKFLRIKPLNDWTTFREQIAQPVKAGRPQRAIKRLHATILNGKPLLNLPDRIVNTVQCQFDPEERAFYNNIQTLVETSLEKLRRQGDVSKSYTTCNHPSLVSQDYRKDKEAVEPKAAKNDDDVDDNADELADLFGGLGLAKSEKRCQICQTPEDTSCSACEGMLSKAKDKSSVAESNLPPTSAKIRMILKLLQDIEDRGEGEKTIIFSQFTSMLDIVEPFLKSRHIKYVRYDGSMSKQHREEALEKIKDSKTIRVILISFKAGSTGLNLTCCNNVILVDLWWNPALEDQAFDRAHRLGQTRTVNIHKLSIPDTVEERILELQEKKRALATAALAGDKLKNMKLGLDDLMDLFKHNADDRDDDDAY
ncbi:hypothetical protein PHLCEN_2v8882 [Hermanssonia centrifuga]|uniref:Uncharacterized protein n=1 Tax=Hermanssonia centrifuga TaxID=98765 RepID=A0A2R6NSA4_9APHY|nr:hypothetical protein PHLCEN_2v8882 [Hermanssonia centrifuga]